MKILKITLITLLLSFIISSGTSCVAYRKDNGKHKGWFKNPNNPHNPNTTNPGKSKGNSNGKSNGKSKK
jgi:hypothetical protein